MKIRLMILLYMLLACCLAGCAPEEAPTLSTTPIIRAVYLVPEQDGVLTAEDLSAHPEIAVVHSLSDLKQAVAGDAAVWIDRGATKTANSPWLRALKCPVVVVGCGDALYAFAKLLDYPVEIPKGAAMDECAQGFCVWVPVTEQSGFVSLRMKGFTLVPVMADDIFSATDEVMGKLR